MASEIYIFSARRFHEMKLCTFAEMEQRAMTIAARRKELVSVSVLVAGDKNRKVGTYDEYGMTDIAMEEMILTEGD